MKQSINLSLGRKKVDSALKKIFYITSSIFFLSVMVSLGLITYRLLLKNSFAELEAKEQSINRQLLALQDKKDKYLETKARISEVNKILSKRSPATARINTIAGILPPDSEVNALNGTQEKVQVTLESDNLASMDDLIEQKIMQLALEKKGGISRAEMVAFGLNPETHKYTVTLNIEFKQ